MSMTPERWNQVKRIFQDALDVPGDQRDAFVVSSCESQADLEVEVERLLALHDRSRDFLESPAMSRSLANSLVTAECLLGAGSRVGAYTIQEVIGEGGMGVVYRAVQDRTKRPVALKVLRTGFASRETIHRFTQEARLLGRLQHAGIAQIVEAGTSKTEFGERPFFAMELVEGLPATHYARKHDLSVAQKLDLLAAIADAVHHAHDRGMIHRDLKPANILVDANGQPKVLDFGVARMTGADVYVTTLRTTIGKLIGTIPYMSPEQVAGDPTELDGRSDVYALGVIGYELLTGRLPYELADKPIPEAVRIIGQDDPTPLSSISRLFRGDIETMLSKALQKDRTQRYPSAAAFAADIRRHLQNEPIAARRTSTWYQLRRFARRNKALTASVVLAFLALLLGTTVATWQGLRANEQLRTANSVNLFLHDLLESPFSQEHDRDVTVLELFEKVPGELETRFPDKPQVKAPIYLAVGNTYQQVGLVETAEPYVRQGYEYFVQAYGDDHEQTLNAMAWLALLLERQGKLTEAESLGRHLLEIHARRHESVDAFPVGSVVNLANVVRQQGRFDEAERMLRDALAQCARAGAPPGGNSLYAEAVLARCLTATGQLDEAGLLAEDAYDGFRRLFGTEDWHPLYAMNAKALVWKAQARTAEAETLMREILESRRRVLGDRHPDTIASSYELASLVASRNDFLAALELTRYALAQAVGVMREDHWRLARLRGLQGVCQGHLGLLDDAERNLTCAYDDLTAALGAEHPETLAALRRLIAFYDASGRNDLAARHRNILTPAAAE